MHIDPAQLDSVQHRTPAEVRLAQDHTKAAKTTSADLMPKSPSASHPIVVQPHERDVNVQWTGQVMILRFVDKQTGTLVQQIPSEEVLRVVRNLQELLRKQASVRPLASSSL